MIEKRRKMSKLWAIIAIALMLVSMIGASLVQTSGGSVKIKNIKFETNDGKIMSGTIYIPKSVSADNPAPAVVTSHGVLDNNKLQDVNCIELSRRGFIVFAPNMYSHGESELAADPGEAMCSLYEAVKMVATMNIVDKEHIGLNGHSMGGMGTNIAVGFDNEADEQLIAAAMTNSADPSYVDEDGEWTNIYGNRDAATIASEYDEYFFCDVDAEGNMTPAREYINHNNAQSFLHFGKDPDGLDKREANVEYTEKIDGKEATRIVYAFPQIHQQSWFSRNSANATISFFSKSLNAPNPIDAGNQVWMFKQLFNLIGLVGFGIFVASIVGVLICTRPFEALEAPEIVAPAHIEGKDQKMWFWGMLIVEAAFAAITYFPITIIIYNTYGMDRFNPIGVSLWAAACGIFDMIVLAVYYFASGKKNGFDAKECGIRMPWKKVGKTVILAVVVLAAAYGCLFFADYFFKTDFRFWVVTIETFEAEKVWVALYSGMLPFIFYYIVNSITINCFDYNDIGKKPWVNTTILAIANGLPAAILILIQYGHNLRTGFLQWIQHGNATVCLWPIVAFLPAAAVVSRKIYKVTKNPYLSGIIIGVIVTMADICCTMIYA